MEDEMPIFRRWSTSFLAALAVLIGGEGCSSSVSLLPREASAAGLLGGLAPWWIERVEIGSLTDWDVSTAQDWARQCEIKNESNDDPVYLGTYSETGSFDVTDNYRTIAPGAAQAIQLTADMGAPDTVHRSLPLASSVASHPVSILCESAIP